MSIRAVAWVFEQQIFPSSVKFVLVALADNAGENGEAWPSLTCIISKTGQDRKTVIAGLDKLERDKWIRDTGRRTGHTKQVKVYAICALEKMIPEAESLNRPENGTGPGNGQEQARKRDTEPPRNR